MQLRPHYLYVFQWCQNLASVLCLLPAVPLKDPRGFSFWSDHKWRTEFPSLWLFEAWKRQHFMWGSKILSAQKVGSSPTQKITKGKSPFMTFSFWRLDHVVSALIYCRYYWNDLRSSYLYLKKCSGLFGVVQEVFFIFHTVLTLLGISRGTSNFMLRLHLWSES